MHREAEHIIFNDQEIAILGVQPSIPVSEARMVAEALIIKSKKLRIEQGGDTTESQLLRLVGEELMVQSLDY